ncbi:MAG: DUF4968 domain-containing protein, partial [Bacteroidota bacterium]|nr:DUF4968 domain-containing protein [Bacteroidota bacterium]
MKLICFWVICLFPALCMGQCVKSYEQTKEGVSVTTTDGMLGIYPIEDNAVRVKCFKGAEPVIPEMIFTGEFHQPEFMVASIASKLVVKTNKITVTLDKQTGNITFSDNKGKVFLSEKAGSRKLTAGTVMGEPCYEVEQSFDSPAGEYIFGLGQFQDGNYDLRGVTRRLIQVNSQIAIPFVYSSKGYGLLWHQYGLTDFNPADNFIPLQRKEQQTGNEQVAEVTTTSGTQKVSQNQSLYLGKFNVPLDGEYSLFLDLGDMGNRHLIVIDGKP